MKKRFFIVILIFLFMAGFEIIPAFAENQSMEKKDAKIKYMAKYKRSEILLHDTMRMLWEQHVMWTRMVIIDIADGLASQANDTARLLKNYDDMEDALKPFYGVEKAEEFGELMKAHLTIAAELVQAAKNGDSAATADAEKRWYANADSLAGFFNKVNKKLWQKKAVQDMFYEHLKMTKDEAVARLNKDYSTDSMTYDAIEKQAIMMADALSDGLIKQFPAKFNSNTVGWENYKEPSIKVMSDATLGNIIVAHNNMTLYTTNNDSKNMSNCYGVCAQNWPPFTLAEKEKPVKNQKIKGDLKIIKRTDGMMQVSYKGWPLYFWIGDKKEGDTTGNGVNGVWSVVTP
jgi:predicted lipoprotein with Yx(FWY)xxD motif